MWLKFISLLILISASPFLAFHAENTQAMSDQKVSRQNYIAPTSTPISDEHIGSAPKWKTSYDVELGGDGILTVCPGFSSSFAITVKNMGTEPDTYTITAKSSMGWSSIDNVPSSISLKAGDRKRIKIKMTIPIDAKNGEVEELYVLATSRNNPNMMDSASIEVDVINCENENRLSWLVSFIFAFGIILGVIVFKIVQRKK
jgi:uncharacterized membrane protein